MNLKHFFNKISARKMLLFVIVIIATSSFFSSLGFARTILFQDDFEDGNADDWNLAEGWMVEDDNGNFVLGGTQHSFAVTGDVLWRNYRFKTDVKLLAENSVTHLNYRNNGCIRYFIGFHAAGVYLHKTFPCGTHPVLKRISEIYEVGRWYSIEIVGIEGTIQVYIDNILKIDYTDPDPLLTGSIAFETLDNAYVYFDNVMVTTDEAVSLSSWENTNGPLGGLGYDVRIHPINKNLMFVTDNFAGVARTENAGQKWSQTNSGIDTRSGLTGDAFNIFSLTIDPNLPDIVWAGTNGERGQFGVFKSIDGGASWHKKVNGISLGFDSIETGLVFRGFTIQEGNSNVVYAQAEVQTKMNGREFNRVRGRVYRTLDGGQFWQLIWSGDNLARYLIIDPGDSDVLYLSTGIFDREAYNSNCGNSFPGGVGVLKSTDGGQTWNPINNGLTDLYAGALRMHPANPRILFAATGNNACSGGYDGDIVSNLFKTTDGGETWIKMLQEDDIMTTVNFSASNPNIVYAGSARAFYKSSNGGATWTRLQNSNNIWGPEGVRAGVPIDVTVDPDNPNILYANNYGGGVFRSLDGAATWQVWSTGYTGAELHDLHVPAGKSAKVYVIGRSGPFVSFNYGLDWTGIATGDANQAEWYSITAHPRNPKIVLIADEHQGVILRSIDGGSHFTEILRHPATNPSDPSKRQGFKSMVFSTFNPNIVYAGLSKDRLTFETSSPAGTVVYKSANAGLSFSPISSIIDGYNINELVVNDQNSNQLYAATTNGVYKSSDGALSWEHCIYLGTKHIEALVIDPAQPGYILAGEGFQGSGIWISQDDGVTWSGPHNSGFNSANPYISALIKDPNHKKTFFASDLYSGVYQSEDNGIDWSAFPDWQMSGLTFRAVKEIAINEKFMYAATQGGGVFRYARDTKQFLNITAPSIMLLLEEK